LQKAGNLQRRAWGLPGGQRTIAGGQSAHQPGGRHCPARKVPGGQGESPGGHWADADSAAPSQTKRPGSKNLAYFGIGFLPRRIPARRLWVEGLK
jgi:hypothetical protein